VTRVTGFFEHVIPTLFVSTVKSVVLNNVTDKKSGDQINSMDYAPKPAPNKAIDIMDRNRKLVIISVAVVVIIIAALLGSATGFLTLQDSEKTQLKQALNLATQQKNQCNIDLSSATASLDNCKSRLDSTKNDLTTCQSDLASVKNIVSQLDVSVNQCNDEKAAIQKNLDRLQTDYNMLTANAAKAVCCTPGLTSAQWDVQNNSIVCVGNQTLVC